MLLYLAEFLSQYYSGFNVFQYLTLRAILGVLTALVIALALLADFLLLPTLLMKIEENSNEKSTTTATTA